MARAGAEIATVAAGHAPEAGAIAAPRNDALRTGRHPEGEFSMNGQMIIPLDPSDRQLVAAALADKQRPPAVPACLWDALCAGCAPQFTLADFASIVNHCGPDVRVVLGFCAGPLPSAPVDLLPRRLPARKTTCRPGRVREDNSPRAAQEV
jgi:hypothetical protein